MMGIMISLLIISVFGGGRWVCCVLIERFGIFVVCCCFSMLIDR